MEKVHQKASLGALAAWVWRHSAGSRASVISICIFGILRVAAGLSFVWVSKMLIDAATSRQPASEIWKLSAYIIILMLCELALSLIVSYLSALAEADMKNRMRATLYSRLMSSDWGSRKGLHSGDLLNRLTEDVRVVVDVVTDKLPGVVVMAAQLIAAFFMLYFMSPILALCVIAIIPIFLLLSKVYVRKMRGLTLEIRSSEGAIQTSMQEGLQHHAAVQTLECEQQMDSRLDNIQSGWRSRLIERMRFSIFSRGMVRLGFIVGYLTAFIWSAFHLRTGAITFGSMTAFLQLVSRIQAPMSGLTQSISPFVYATSSIDRLMELENMMVEDKSEPIVLPPPIGLRFSNVSFAYAADEPDVLSDFSYDFRPGSKTVVMGQTGAGKTTIARLILALLRPNKGRIELYSSSTGMQAEAAPATRCNMVYVPQGNTLLAGTVRDNLLLGNPEASDQQLREALHTAVADFVYNLPSGLDTVCGELGIGLSEGQAQRIAIARALLRNGPLLILDEFNSALDESTASTLMERLTASRPKSTIIFISHRPEVAAYCDATLRI